ncbi:putative membrane-bound protein [Comamonas testosteroni TK102]|uniref:Putative membrane-bound protein n=1 Tax=Comamonas testosteroni TK102 TaxID=1392005 RepID=A0A076PJ69_COMTE|nr:putative membrane-bound protein [Comamonas testosteroni TK102]
MILLVDSEPQRGVWQKAAHHLINLGAILRTQKVMRGINGMAPDLYRSCPFVGAGSSNGSHRRIMYTKHAGQESGIKSGPCLSDLPDGAPAPR